LNFQFPSSRPSSSYFTRESSSLEDRIFLQKYLRTFTACRLSTDEFLTSVEANSPAQRVQEAVPEVPEATVSDAEVLAEAADTQQQEKTQAVLKIQSFRRGESARKKVSKLREKQAPTKEKQVAVKEEIVRTAISAAESADLLMAAFEGNEFVVQKVQLALEQKRPLAELNLRQCCLGKEGTELLAKGLWQNGTVTTLELSGNYIGCCGVQHLIATLQSMTLLSKLGLSWNSVANDGAIVLASALKGLPKLGNLDLGYNRVRDEGAAALAAALKALGRQKQSRLKALDLQGNLLGFLGVDQLAKACGAKVKLQLHGNCVIGRPTSGILCDLLTPLSPKSPFGVDTSPRSPSAKKEAPRKSKKA